MAIEFVGAAANDSTFITIPTHQVGDLLLIFAYRDQEGSTVVASPSRPTGWPQIGSSAGNGGSIRVCAGFATTTTHTSGTWTNADGLIVYVYRGVSGVGTFTVFGELSSTVKYPAANLTRLDGTSWVVRSVGCPGGALGAYTVPGHASRAQSTAGRMRGLDMGGPVATSPGVATQASLGDRFRACTLELLGPVADVSTTKFFF